MIQLNNEIPLRDHIGGIRAGIQGNCCNYKEGCILPNKLVLRDAAAQMEGEMVVAKEQTNTFFKNLITSIGPTVFTPIANRSTISLYRSKRISSGENCIQPCMLAAIGELTVILCKKVSLAYFFFLKAISSKNFKCSSPRQEKQVKYYPAPSY